ncbi:hypothetical protein SCOR_15135 [Sulfidibacter corallicola]|uniref:Uncharacterized protein n=1 Tax=Sulfidibacter corallicola TaxID=2818388 RepID=A0A8A4TYA0_SULCO|nr:hypothetical protein [Sulfidibacter corallicola]QTD54198.1 hypothetical protein J3U87_17265 [Sulfidibacter corallicola]
MFTFELPCGLEAEIREMTGAEEEILTNQRLIRNGSAINQVLKNCLVRLGDNDSPTMNDVLDLLSGDRLALLVELRRVSLGSEVELELVCTNPTCREANPFTVDLGALETKPYGDAREFEFTLPSSNRTVRFRYLDGHMEKRLATLKEPSIASAMTMRIIDIDGKPPSKRVMQDMSLRDRQALRAEMDRVNAGIDTAITVDCEACGERLRTRLEAEPGFLFPGAAL